MKTFVSVNQFWKELLPQAHKLKCDGINAVFGNTPGRDVEFARSLIDAINPNNIFLETGGIDEKQLLDTPNWAQPVSNLKLDLDFFNLLSRQLDCVMPYHEYDSTFSVHTTQTVLSLHNIAKAFELSGRKKIFPMAREFTGESQRRVRNALTAVNRVGGILWELEANLPLVKNQAIPKGLTEVHNAGKHSKIMIAGRNVSTEYSLDVKEVVVWLKSKVSSAVWQNLWIGVAFYEAGKGIDWFGGVNSVEQALIEVERLK